MTIEYSSVNTASERNCFSALQRGKGVERNKEEGRPKEGWREGGAGFGKDWKGVSDPCV